MNHYSDIIRLLDRFLADKNAVSKEELLILRAFYTSADGRAFLEQWLKERWQQEPSNNLGIDFASLFGQIEEKIGEPKGKKIGKKVSLRIILMRFAAILAIPLLVGGALFFAWKPQPVYVLSDTLPVSVQEYISPAGTRSKILLPDSTQVWLNAASTLKIAEDFGYGERRVVLSGEAFFEVSHKEHLPFVVSTPDMDIKVLGTRFNVSAYSDNKEIEAVLVSGQIEVTHKHADKESESVFTMSPSQLLKIHTNNHMARLTNNVNTDLYTAWKDNKLVFEDTPMEEVVVRLERWFNVMIELDSSDLRKYTFTGSFENRTLNQILSYLMHSSPLSYTIKGDQVSISSIKQSQ